MTLNLWSLGQVNMMFAFGYILLYNGIIDRQTN